MSVDLTKLLLHTSYPAFKNNTVYTGSFNISGTVGAGANVVSATVALSVAPDLVDIIFNGQGEDAFGSTTDPRPSSAWFKDTGGSSGSPDTHNLVWVRGDNAPAFFIDYPTPWSISSRILGTSLIITATYIQTFPDVLTLTSTPVYYRLVDYSVF